MSRIATRLALAKVAILSQMVSPITESAGREGLRISDNLTLTCAACVPGLPAVVAEDFPLLLHHHGDTRHLRGTSFSGNTGLIRQELLEVSSASVSVAQVTAAVGDQIPFLGFGQSTVLDPSEIHRFVRPPEPLLLQHVVVRVEVLDDGLPGLRLCIYKFLDLVAGFGSDRTKKSLPRSAQKLERRPPQTLCSIQQRNPLWVVFLAVSQRGSTKKLQPVRNDVSVAREPAEKRPKRAYKAIPVCLNSTRHQRGWNPFLDCRQQLRLLKQGLPPKHLITRTLVVTTSTSLPAALLPGLVGHILIVIPVLAWARVDRKLSRSVLTRARPLL
eukprot:jgi/Mesvir1/8711/Mv26110-RA.1